MQAEQRDREHTSPYSSHHPHLCLHPVAVLPVSEPPTRTQPLPPPPVGLRLARPPRSRTAPRHSCPPAPLSPTCGLVTGTPTTLSYSPAALMPARSSTLAVERTTRLAVGEKVVLICRPGQH